MLMCKPLLICRKMLAFPFTFHVCILLEVIWFSTCLILGIQKFSKSLFLNLLRSMIFFLIHINISEH